MTESNELKNAGSSLTGGKAITKFDVPPALHAIYEEIKRCEPAMVILKLMQEARKVIETQKGPQKGA